MPVFFSHRQNQAITRFQDNLTKNRNFPVMSPIYTFRLFVAKQTSTTAKTPAQTAGVFIIRILLRLSSYGEVLPPL